MDEDEGPGTLRKIMSAMAVLLGVMVWAGLLIQGGQDQLSKEFMILYGFLGGFSILMGVVSFISDFAVKNLSPESFLAKAFFIFERSQLRPGSLFLGIPFIVMGLLTLLVIVIVSSSSASIFPTANPYAASLAWTPEALELSGRGVLSPFFNGAVVPGILEEMTIFFAIQAMIFFILLALWGITKDEDIAENPFIYWLTAFGSIATWSIIFAFAHGRFGGNTEALTFAFLFEFVMQTANQMTGSFISWLPHITHNAMVIANRSFSFVTFAIVPLIPYIPRNLYGGWRKC